MSSKLSADRPWWEIPAVCVCLAVMAAGLILDAVGQHRPLGLLVVFIGSCDNSWLCFLIIGRKGRVAEAERHELQAFAASGDGEPLRCCLRYARPGEPIALISYAPFDHPSVWTEVGAVYVHSALCAGYPTTGMLPKELRTGPCVLRTYDGKDEMNYDHNTVITDDADLEPIIMRLLTEPDVATVHVRTLAPQCFLYAITGG